MPELQTGQLEELFNLLPIDGYVTEEQPKENDPLLLNTEQVHDLLTQDNAE